MSPTDAGRSTHRGEQIIMTTTYDPAADSLTTPEFADKIFDSVLGAVQIQALYLGDRLGWYRALAEEGPLTATELAHRTGSAERYAREWLEHQAVSGIVTVDLNSEPARFGLPRAYVEVLVDADSLSYMAPMARYFVATGARLPDLVAAYRIGGGVSWEQLGTDAREAQGALNRPMFLHQLAAELLPQIPDLHQSLQAGARVADVGCGEGWSAIGLALGYPACEIDGYDIDEPSIRTATRNAAGRGWLTGSHLRRTPQGCRPPATTPSSHSNAFTTCRTRLQSCLPCGASPSRGRRWW
jgi:hypothetical protein